MGLLKTNKLDNGMIGFECIYGGVEAPFGGIDASKSPRYIDPRCFADASNFLVVDNELCACSLIEQPFPSNGLTYPIEIVGFGVTSPANLIGVGKLPCENIVKNWALFTSSLADSSGFYHYRLILWTNDVVATESYDFAVPMLSYNIPAKNAAATLLVSYANPFTANQSTPEFTLHLSGGGTIATPYAYGGLLYEVCQWNYAVNGIPSGGVSSYSNSIFSNSYQAGFILCNTPAGGVPTCIPTPAMVAANINSIINSSGTYPFTSAIDGGNPNLLHLTARSLSGYASVDGAVGNSLNLSGAVTVQEFGYYPLAVGLSFIVCNPAVPPNVTDPNPFMQPSFQISVSPFLGGVDSSTYTQKPIQNLTYETVGDSLFISGWPANYMLQFSNKTKQFYYLTQYEGARVLKKLAGHLISVGMIPGIDSTNAPIKIDNPHLWFSWSAEGNLSQWAALDTSNLVTGAGGGQLGDISDMLTGLVVSNSVAFILRAEGLSYGSVLQGASIPFDINHVALCRDGQGCSSTSLWTQFDQLGFYVGNSNIFMLQQGPQAIGDKIVEFLFPALIADSSTNPPFFDFMYNDTNVEPLTMVFNNRTITVFAVNIAGSIFVFDPQDGTWMRFDTINNYPNPPGLLSPPSYSILKCISLPANGITGYGGSYQYKAAYTYIQQVQRVGLHFMLQGPKLYQFMPVIGETAYVVFPAEEISLGRDITIDGIYAAVSGIPGATIVFTIGGWQGNPSTYIDNAFHGTLVLGANASTVKYEEYQIFDDATAGAITLKAPQLTMTVIQQSVSYTPATPYPFDSNPQFKSPKIVMFGSFDPNQRPL